MNWRMARKRSWSRLLRGARSIAVLTAAGLLAACATVEEPRANLLDGRAVIKDLRGDIACWPLAQAKTLEKVLFGCSDGVILIATAGTGAWKVLGRPAELLQPFVHRDGHDTLLYFAGNSITGSTIREIDLRAETQFQRPMIVPDGFSLMSAYLNPRDRCLVASLIVKQPWPWTGVLRVYDYDPRGRTPVRLDGPSVIEVSQGDDPRHVGAPNSGGAICVRDRTGQIVLLRNQFNSDDQPDAIGARITRVTATDARVIYRGGESMQFLQPKLAPYVYARNGVSPGMLRIDVDTGEITTIGAGVDGWWVDFDPQAGVGVVSKSLGDVKQRICVADLNGCRHSVRELHDLSAPSASNGWLGDGFITMVYMPFADIVPMDYTQFYWLEAQ